MFRSVRPERLLRTAVVLTAVGAALVASVSSTTVAADTSTTTGTWTVQSSPNPTGAIGSGLGAVSCSEPGTCVAVGSASYPSGLVPSPSVLVERLADGAWTIETTPPISGATSSSLSGVSCPVTGFCVAVGSVQLTSQRSPDSLVESWNGTSWSATILPLPSGGSEPGLVAVSCAAPGACLAIGTYALRGTDTYRPLAERLAGSKWSVLSTPVPPHGGGSGGDSEFSGVDCTSTVHCEVVGNVAYNDTLENAFAYGLTGSTWSHQRQVNPGPDPDSIDSAVSCSGAHSCTSVGTVAIVGELALVEYWDGSTWVRQETPVSNRRPDQSLSDVSCGGGSSCVSVGEAYRVNQKNGHLVGGRAVAEVWSDGAWSLSRPVVPSGVSASLDGISCTSPSACVAVGGASTSSGETTLVEAYRA
jgi:hypothetical protein